MKSSLDYCTLSRYILVSCTGAVSDMAQGRSLISAQFGVELPSKESDGEKWPVVVSDSANLWSRIITKAGSEQLRLENLKGWKPLHSGSMSQGCTTLPGKELFLTP